MIKKYSTKKSSILGAMIVVTAIIIPSIAVSEKISEAEAVSIATLWYAMEINSNNSGLEEEARMERLSRLNELQVLYYTSGMNLVDTIRASDEVYAYIVIYKPDGFIVVSSDDRIESIISFSINTTFLRSMPEGNFMSYYLRTSLFNRWDALKSSIDRNEDVQIHSSWSILRSKLQSVKDIKGATHEIPTGAAYYRLWSTALWSQEEYYNATARANNGGNDVPTGCTATAMAILMRFHSYPLTGNGSHAYQDNEDLIQYYHSINFSSQSYDWSQMPTSSLTSGNSNIANLMYHCGVAVEMNYELSPPGSGAWPSATAMNNYFRYYGTRQLSNSHDESIIACVKGGLPVIVSSGGEGGGHTVVVCGYRDDVFPYYYLNCGWNGASNGWYSLNDIPPNSYPIARSYPYCRPTNYIYIDGSWNDTGCGTTINPYETLSEGVPEVPVDGQLRIRGWTYSGSGNVPIEFGNPMVINSYEGTAVVGSSLSLTNSGSIRIYENGQIIVH